MSVSRSNIQSHFLHVMCHGIGDEYIFNTKDEKAIYSSMMMTYLKKFNLIMMANCIMHNHVHFVFYVDPIKALSDYIKKLNHDYALYFNQKHETFGHVFSGRYNVEEIDDTNQLATCISYVHQNSVEAGICCKAGDYTYSSYNDYLFKKGILENQDLIDLMRDSGITIDKVLNYTDYEENFIEPKTDIERIIARFLMKNRVGFDELYNSRKLFSQLVIKLYLKCGMNQIELAERFSLSRHQIQRLLAKNKNR